MVTAVESAPQPCRDGREPVEVGPGPPDHAQVLVAHQVLPALLRRTPRPPGPAPAAAACRTSPGRRTRRRCAAPASRSRPGRPPHRTASTPPTAGPAPATRRDGAPRGCGTPRRSRRGRRRTRPPAGPRRCRGGTRRAHHGDQVSARPTPRRTAASAVTTASRKGAPGQVGDVRAIDVTAIPPALDDLVGLERRCTQVQDAIRRPPERRALVRCTRTSGIRQTGSPCSTAADTWLTTAPPPTCGARRATRERGSRRDRATGLVRGDVDARPQCGEPLRGQHPAQLLVAESGGEQVRARDQAPSVVHTASVPLGWVQAAVGDEPVDNGISDRAGETSGWLLPRGGGRLVTRSFGCPNYRRSRLLTQQLFWLPDCILAARLAAPFA